MISPYKRSKLRKRMKGAINAVLPLSYTSSGYSPFEFHDPTYLQHLREMLKLQETKEFTRAQREALIEQSKRDNYRQELLRLQNEIPRYSTGHPTKAHLEQRTKELENLIKM